MEWGPRALGNRSILSDPRDPNMREIINLKIKKEKSLDLLRRQYCLMSNRFF